MVNEQKFDSTLAELFWLGSSMAEVKNAAERYFIEGGVFLIKSMPYKDGFLGDPVHQVMIPEKKKTSCSACWAR